jgi:hypothetical protein
MAEHSIVGPSAAERWFNCPPSALLESKMKDSSSSYAEEGSLAHELGKIKLQYHFGLIRQREYEKSFEKIKAHTYYTKELYKFTMDYVDFCLDVYYKIQRKNETVDVFIEEKIKLDYYIPDGVGTADFVVIANKVLHVIDLKFGANKYVNAEDNKQFKIYALGTLVAHSEVYEIDKIEMTVYQPRMDNISTETISAKRLLNWGENILKPAAELAYYGHGEKTAGDHCQFCKIKGRCNTFAEAKNEAAKLEFKDPDLLTDEELVAIYPKLKQIKSWAEAVEKYMLSQALKEGYEWKGLKLVAGGQGRRTFTNEDAVVKRLKEMEVRESYYTALASLTKIETALGKSVFSSKLGDLVHRPAGKPTLTDINDPRPAYDRNKEAAEIFKDIDEDF